MRIVTAVLAGGLGLLGILTPARAHHSFAAEFDQNKPVKLRGTITKIERVNPHSWIYVDVKDSDGKVINWMIEGGSPNTLLRRGVTRNTLPAGTEIVVDGYQAEDGTNRANGRDPTFADGRELSLGSSLNSAPDEKQGE